MSFGGDDGRKASGSAVEDQLVAAISAGMTVYRMCAQQQKHPISDLDVSECCSG
jgi:hypothetical protein